METQCEEVGSEHDNINMIKDQLKEMGFSYSGKAKIISGATGQKIDAEIYINPDYFNRSTKEEKI